MLSGFQPVISLDTAHLHSSYKGTSYIYLGLTGADEVYINVYIWDQQW